MIAAGNVKYSVLKAYSAKRAKKVEFDNKMSVIPDRTPAQRKSYRERTKSTQAVRTNVGNSSDTDSATNPTGDSASRSSTENNQPLLHYYHCYYRCQWRFFKFLSKE